MKHTLLVMLFAAAATAAVVSNDVPDVVKLPDADKVVLLPDVADVDVNEAPKVLVTKVEEPTCVTDGAEDTAVADRLSLSVGARCNTLIYDYEHMVNGTAPAHTHVSEIRVESKEGWIAAVRVTRLGVTQGATPSIVSGGVGSYFVTIRIRSAAGRGFHYRVQIYDLKVL